MTDPVLVPQDDSLSIMPGGALRGRLRIPGDKSISHRAIMLGALGHGSTRISNFLMGEDCLATLRCFRAMGVRIAADGDGWLVHGTGFEGLQEPFDVLDVGNSGTTIRLMLGILASGSFFATVTGDESIRRRPMARIVQPLREMGAQICGRQQGKLAPLAVQGTRLQAIDYVSPVASAQIKSAVLLAGLNAKGVTSVTEPALSRDHTERMLAGRGAKIWREGLRVFVEGGHPLRNGDVQVPGDISSAAFWLVAASIAPGSDLLLEGVGINPTRTGILDVLERMGADIQRRNERDESGEPVADLHVRFASLKGTTIGGDEIPRLVDEIPILALAASCAEGSTVIRDAAELRVKESDRLKAIARELGKLGAKIQELPDGLVIEGEAVWCGGKVESLGDHRMAMTLGLAALLSSEPVTVVGTACTETSHPGFWEILADLRS